MSGNEAVKAKQNGEQENIIEGVKLMKVSEVKSKLKEKNLERRKSWQGD